MVVAYGDSPHSQLATTTTVTANPLLDWGLIDAEFESIIGPTAYLLGSDDISLAEAGDLSSLY